MLEDDDGEWQRLDQKRAEHAAAGRWARYRTATLRMAKLRERQGRLEDALIGYLELCYIDLNGAQNPGAAWGMPLRQLDPARAFGLGPLIVRRLRALAGELGYDARRVEAEFLATAVAMNRRLELPVGPEEAWLELRGELYHR